MTSPAARRAGMSGWWLIACCCIGLSIAVGPAFGALPRWSGASPERAAMAARGCGSIAEGGSRVRVEVRRGKVTCATARYVIKHNHAYMPGDGPSGYPYRGSAQTRSGLGTGWACWCAVIALAR